MSRHLWFLVFDRRALRFTRRALKSGPVQVFADSITEDARKVLHQAPLPDGVFSLKPVHISVEDVLGRNLHARADELLSILIMQSAVPLNDVWLPRSQKPWAAEWHRIHAALLYDDAKPIADFLAFVERAYAIGDIAPPEALLIDVGFHVGAHVVTETGQQAPLHLDFPFSIRGQAPGIFAAVAHQVLRHAALALRTQFRRIRRGPPERSIAAGGKHVVLVEYEAAGWDRMPLGHAQDWIRLSGLPPNQIVLYFDRDDSPLDDAARNELTRCGHGWIDHVVPTWHARRPMAAVLSCIADLVATMPAPWKRHALRRWALLARFLPVVRWQREFLRSTGAVALYQHDEFNPRQVALNLACRQEGVAFLWSFHSVLFFFEYMRYAFVDLLLAWGALDLGFVNAAGFDYRYAVQVGPLGTDGAEADDTLQAVEWRTRLVGKPRFVVTLFDSSYDARLLHHSAERCAAFYKTVLSLVRANPDWGCVIKSKGDAYVRLPPEPGLQDVVAELTAAGRCLILPRTMKPSLAALIGDAVACYSINTAGFQAAVRTGRPTLHFDPNHLIVHPLFKPGEGAIIFRDAESFAAALAAVAKGDSRFGDVGPWRQMIDPFGDGMGRQRSGEVIRDYVMARDSGLGRDDALRQAINAYATRYNSQELATTRWAPHGTEADSLWRSVVRDNYPEAPPDFPFTLGALSAPALRPKK